MSTTPVLVDAAWAQAHLDDPNVRFVEVDVDTTSYEQSHLPGAVGWNWTSQLADGIRRDIAGQRRLLRPPLGRRHRPRHDDRPVRRQQQLVRGVGLLAAEAVRPQGRPNPRRRPQVLAGPRPAAVDRRARATPATGYRLPEPDFALRAFRDDILPRLSDKELVLVDVRAPAEFSGELLAPPGLSETAQRAGHIPGAASIPWAQTVREDGTFKSLDDLAALYAAKGVTVRQGHHCLLPDRRAVVAHLVRPARAARLSPGAQLRRQLDRVGQHGRRADREDVRGESHRLTALRAGRRRPTGDNRRWPSPLPPVPPPTCSPQPASSGFPSSMRVAPIDAAELLRGWPGLALLESARPGRRSRWTFLTADPVAVMLPAESRAGSLRGGAPDAPAPDADASSRRAGSDPARRSSAASSASSATTSGSSSSRGRSSSPTTRSLPQLRLALHDWVIAWDRRYGQAWLGGRAARRRRRAPRRSACTAVRERVATGHRPPVRRSHDRSRTRARLRLEPGSRRVRGRRRGDPAGDPGRRDLPGQPGPPPVGPVRRRSVAALSGAADRGSGPVRRVPRPRPGRARRPLRRAPGDRLGLARIVPVGRRRRPGRPRIRSRAPGPAAGRPRRTGPWPPSSWRAPRTAPRT